MNKRNQTLVVHLLEMLVGLHLVGVVSVELGWNVGVYGVQRGRLLRCVRGDDYSVMSVATKPLVGIAESREAPLGRGHLEVLVGRLVAEALLASTVGVLVGYSQVLVAVGVQVVLLALTFGGRLSARPLIVHAFYYRALTRTGLWAQCLIERTRRDIARVNVKEVVAIIRTHYGIISRKLENFERIKFERREDGKQW